MRRFLKIKINLLVDVTSLPVTILIGGFQLAKLGGRILYFVESSDFLSSRESCVSYLSPYSIYDKKRVFKRSCGF